MGLSNMMGGETEDGKNVDSVKTDGPDFGDRLGGFLQNRFPVAGGLSNMVFGEKPQGNDPLMQAPPIPGQGGGLSAIFKLLGVGG